VQQSITRLNRDVHQPKILLMPVDIELTRLTAAGLEEPRADWTAAAKRNVIEVLREEQRRRGNAMVEYHDDPASASDDEVFDELSKLHGVVGATIAEQSPPHTALPTKRTFDWSLGPEVRKFKQRYDADYALFIYIRDSYTGGGRRTAMIVAAALGFIGSAFWGGEQVGYSSLVDLNTGDIVWFSQLDRLRGDLRTKKRAEETLRKLLAGLPR